MSAPHVCTFQTFSIDCTDSLLDSDFSHQAHPIFPNRYSLSESEGMNPSQNSQVAIKESWYEQLV